MGIILVGIIMILICWKLTPPKYVVGDVIQARWSNHRLEITNIVMAGYLVKNSAGSERELPFDYAHKFYKKVTK